ncbi:hypothetical protein D3C86_1032050 [compost metagenome]
MQLLIDGFFLFQQAGVLGEFVAETGDMTDHFIEDGLVALILDRGFQLFGLGQCLTGLFDLALSRAVVALAALVQAHARFVHGLQHQPGNLTDLVGLLDELRTVLALGILQGVGAVIGKPGLQHVEVVGHAGHRPTGHFQCEVLGLAERDKLVERLAIGAERLLDIIHHRHIRRRRGLELVRQGDQAIDTLVQGFDGFRVAVQGILLLQQAHLQQTAVERRHLLEPVETMADGLQGPDADGRHQRGQQQHQHKPDTQFFCHTEVGKTSLRGRNHCT